MKVILGIDTKEAYKPALDLLAKLRFDGLHVTLFHVAPSVCPITGADARVDAEYTKVVQNIGLAALDDAQTEANSRNVPNQTRLVFGRAADEMMREADAQGADLVAICATHRGELTSSALGSATCALAIGGSASLLVAKGAAPTSDRFTVVLATDNSPAAQHWIERFIALGPKGIDRLHVLSAYEVDDVAAVAAHMNLSMLGGDVERWLQEAMTAKTDVAVKRLAEAGFNVTSEVVNAPAADAIHRAMKSHRADLLVIGAHGALELPGARIGSIALHEIVVEEYPVLLVR